MDKRGKSFPRPLADLLRRSVGDVLARQGFAAGDLVTHWPEIAGADIAALAEPIKMQWQRTADGDPAEPATLVLRVEGPAAIEVQHLTPVILERVNRYLGWRAVGRIALRQAPITRASKPARPAPPSAEETAAVKGRLGGLQDEGLRDALARLGAAVNRK